jgi:hypothetical protein
MARQPFFSGNYGSALGQIDTRPIMQGAAAQAAMYQNLGANIGGAIEKYQLNKEKRDKSESAAMGKIAYIMQNEPNTLFDVAENSPKFGKALRQVSENPGEATYKDFDTINATLASWDQTRTAGIARDQSAEIQGWKRQLAEERKRGEDARISMLKNDADLKALLVGFKQETQDPRIIDALNILEERKKNYAFRDKTQPLREQTDTNRLRAEAIASKKAPLIASAKSERELLEAQTALTEQPLRADIAGGQLAAAKQGQDIQRQVYTQRGGTPRAVADMIKDAELVDRQKQIAGETAELKLEHQKEFGAKTLAAQLESILSTTAARNLQSLASAAPIDPTAAQRMTQIGALTSGKVIQLDPRWRQAAADVLHGGDIDAQPLLVNFMDYQRLVESDRDDGGRKFAMTGKAEEIMKEINRLSAPSWSPQQMVRVK